MLKILIAGGFDESNKDLLPKLHAFAQSLGKEVISQGHLLLNCCRTFLRLRCGRECQHGGSCARAESDGSHRQLCSRRTNAGTHIWQCSHFATRGLGAWQPAASGTGTDRNCRCCSYCWRMGGHPSRGELGENKWESASSNSTLRRSS